MVKLLAIMSIVALTACGAAGSTGATPAASPIATAVPTANPSGWQSTATLHFTIPAAATSGSAVRRHAAGTRSPKFIDDTTNALNFRINSVNGSTTLPAWAPSGTQQIALIVGPGDNCQFGSGENGGIACTVTIPAPPGTVNYTFTAVNTGTGYDLSTQTGNQTFTQGTNNTIAITLQGIVNAIDVQITSPKLDTNGTPAISVTAIDADNEPIFGSAPFANTFVINDPDTTGTTSFFRSGSPGTTYSSWTISEPSDLTNLAFSYTGKAINDFVFTASGSLTGFNVPNAATGVVCNAVGCKFVAPTPDPIVTTGTPIDTDAADTTYNQPTVFFDAVDAAAQIVTASETGFTGTSSDGIVTYGGQFALALDPTSCGAGAAAIASVNTTGPATSFTITPQNVGVCKATLTESGTGYPLSNPAHTDANDGVFYISVTSATLSANGKQRR